jgi:hypothetical protein
VSDYRDWTDEQIADEIIRNVYGNDEVRKQKALDYCSGDKLKLAQNLAFVQIGEQLLRKYDPKL